MFKRFTLGARAAVSQAQSEAQLLNAPEVAPEHIFLGLVGQRQSVAGWVLAQLGVTVDAAREKLRPLVRTAEQPGQIGFSPAAKSLLKGALDQARGMNNNYIGTEHLLLAMFRVETAPIPELLQQFDLKPEPVQYLMLRELGAGHRRRRRASGSQDEPRNNVVMCRVSLADLEAIDALVDAGVCATRSDAAAWLIRAGVEGRIAMFESLQVTVGKIRLLREQAHRITREASSEPAAAAGSEVQTPDQSPRSEPEP